MGRTRTPVAVKFAEGSWDDREDGVPLATRAGEPRKPDWLGPVASQVWDDVVGELGDIEGLLTPLDGSALACYGHAHQRLHEAREILARDGLILEGRRHPALMIESKCVEQITTIGQKFGMTPTARSSLRIDPSIAKNDELEALLR